MVKVIFSISAKVYKTFTVEICMTLTLTSRIGQDQTPINQSKVKSTSYVLSIVMFALPITVYEITTFNLSKWPVFESMIFKK